jgi:hypothetical protein
VPLFDRYHLSQDEAEARLKRPLTGDPTRGEIGLLAALVSNKLDDVQSRLARDATLGADLRELVSEHLKKARARWETRRAWSVTLPLPLWDEYPGRLGLPAARSASAWCQRSDATTNGRRARWSPWRRSTRTSGPSTPRPRSCWRRPEQSRSGLARCRKSACGSPESKALSAEESLVRFLQHSRRRVTGWRSMRPSWAAVPIRTRPSCSGNGRLRAAARATVHAVKIDWPHKRCILCLESGMMTDEHVIPQQIGGTLVVPFLCSDCNSTVGSQVEGALKEDAALRYTVERLKDRIPKLAASIREGRIFSADSPVGQITARVKRGSLAVRGMKGPGGSIIKDTRDARGDIEKALTDQGIEVAAVEALMRRFDEAPLETPVALPGWTVIKRQGRGMKPELNKATAMVNPRVLLKIAYEFLALHMQGGIYDATPALEKLRVAIRQDREDAAAYSADYMRSEDDLVHGLAMFETPHAEVNICLFGWLRFHVHLYEIVVPPPTYAYEHRLDTGGEVYGILTDVATPDSDD